MATKSPKRASLEKSPFNGEQVSWIILKYGELKNVSAVKRAFSTQFYKHHPREVPNYMAFKRIIDRFLESEGHTRPKVKGGLKPPIPQDQITAVKLFFKQNKRAHLAEASRDLNISKSKVWFILRKVLKWRPYRPAASTVLTQQQMSARLDCARWFVRQDPDFFTKKVIWGDEKYFVLHQTPNSQNDKYWRPENPYDVVQCKKQGQAKAMCWVGLVNGKVLGPLWIEGSMDQHVYRELLEDHVWPAVRNVATRQGLWWMQDGATPHTTNYNLEYLLEKFGGRVISNKSEIRWPPCSPDCNPLDFFFWGHAMNHVFRCKPRTLDQLKMMVNDFSQNMEADMIKKVCSSVKKRFRMVEMVAGGHFENKKGKLMKELLVEE